MTPELFFCSLQRSSPRQALRAQGPRGTGAVRAAGWRQQEEAAPGEGPAADTAAGTGTALGLLPCQTQPAPGSSQQVNTFLLTKDLILSSDNCRGIWMTVVLLWLLLPTPNKTLFFSEQQKKAKLSCSPRAAFASQHPSDTFGNSHMP